MPAYFLVEILKITDAAMYGKYIDTVKAVVEKGGGEYVIRTDRVRPFFGGRAPVRIILIRFKDTESLDACFSSDEYRKIAPLREMSTRSRACVIEDECLPSA
ncbi:MAG: DUF1330 domain-containing protein [Syntrophorhabdus sp.]|mgnify:CR=1 FL=1|nr:DUF1330 domain-containing protein [Syntrophorhabdus sp.]